MSLQQQPEENKIQDTNAVVANTDVDPEQPPNLVYTYEAPWIIYSIGFSAKPNQHTRLAIGSFEEGINNTVQILQLDKSTDNSFQVISSFAHKYPPTKLLWVPDTVHSSLHHVERQSIGLIGYVRRVFENMGVQFGDAEGPAEVRFDQCTLSTPP
jgi:hypothetical protein